MDLLLDDSMLDSLLTDARPKEEFKWEMCTYTLHDEAGCAWQPFGGYQQTGDATPHSQLSVTMDRPPLTSTEAHTWLWHKNCVIPPLKVSCSSDGLPLENASCLLSAVRVDVSEHAAHDVGLEGDTLRPLGHGACSFSSLSFKTTCVSPPPRLDARPSHVNSRRPPRGRAPGALRG